MTDDEAYAFYSDPKNQQPGNRLPGRRLVRAEEDDVNRAPEGFSVTARRHGDEYTGVVYLGVQEVYVHTEPVSKTPAGIEDFANVTLRLFAKRLRDLLNPEPAYHWDEES